MTDVEVKMGTGHSGRATNADGGVLGRRGAGMLACIILLVLISFPLRADNALGAITATTEAKSGAFYGQAQEYVYDQSISKNYKNSQLDWPFEPMIFTGAELSLDFQHGIFASLEVRQGFSGKAGTMTDSDFLNGNGVLTLFSQSDSYAERANFLDLKAGWDFMKDGSLTVGAFGAFSYMDLKWTARDGYLQYPPGSYNYGSYPTWSSSFTQEPLYGIGIIYETAYLGGAVGVRSRYTMKGGFVFVASLAFTPLLYCFTEDDHVLRQIAFFSTLSGGLMIEPRVSVEYSPVPRAKIKLDIGYRYAWNLIGDIIEVSTGTSDFSGNFPYVAGPDSTTTGTNDSGASLWALDAGISLSISL